MELMKTECPHSSFNSHRQGRSSVGIEVADTTLALTIGGLDLLLLSICIRDPIPEVVHWGTRMIPTH